MRRRLVTLKVDQFLKSKLLDTPFLVIDLDIIAEKYLTLHKLLPKAQIYYAVKANPEPEILRLLVKLGANFDAASISEIEQCLAVGVPPEQISYGSTLKKARDIARAYQLGVKLYSFDSWGELEKLSVHAPLSRVSCRLLIETQNAEWTLARKFGCAWDMAFDLLQHSRTLDLEPYGVAFHVGSQQTDPTQWNEPIHQVALLFSKLAAQGIDLQAINLGGGFPVKYQSPIPSEEVYAQVIQTAISHHFGDNPPQVMLEPGRFLVADAGTIQSEIVSIAKKSYTDEQRWVFLDVGKFNGLMETLDECIKYRIRTPYDGSAVGSVVLAGPTCDSADILYERSGYKLPLSLQIGDRIDILSTGAYTHTYSSVGFNGIPPLKVYCI
ncbi:type III PLP-dependent enzyme [Nostoc calcicola FACHB-3891]|nr:type III PLP-dependent enzyme [Nostoc calcicola FACHB-3891]